ncbi:MAG UNVERIFIED_CONTAM: pyridoxal phosphate-dependent aminotransferase [Rickettsiaceae bacterium]|jgi:aspartate aminotransferase
MSLIASSIAKIKPSPTLSLTQKAAELKKQGADIISLTVGEPDFDTPENVKEAAINAIQAGFTKYTNVDGIVELKMAIQKKLLSENDLDYELKEIMVSNGGKQVIYNLFMASINPGDEVIIPAPYWVSYIDIVMLAGGTPVVVDCTEEDNFKLSYHKLRKAITSKTKWVIINSPSNPTGLFYDTEELESVAEVMRECPQIHVLTDDIYEHIIFDNKKFVNLAMVAPDLKSRIFIVNGVSKAYSMTGWRIGYGVGNPELIKAMTIIQSQSTSNPCSISQKAAIEAISGNQEFVKKQAIEFETRRNFVLSQLKQIHGMDCVTPDGAFYLFPSCKEFFGKITPGGTVINDSSDFANYLLQYFGVAVVPGSAFGAEGYFRISYATSKDVLIDACMRIIDACEKLMHA